MTRHFGGGGVIAIYPTPNSLADKVNEYFDSCFVMKHNTKLGVDMPYEIKTPTYSGLARYLGFGSRTALLEYANKRDEAYEDVINDAKLRLEEYYEAKLIHSKNPTGLIFALKNNAEWEDVSKKQIAGDSNTPLLFTWASESQAGDVVTIDAEKSETEGVLPPTTQLLGGSIDVE